jgi:hypothetical protein
MPQMFARVLYAPAAPRRLFWSPALRKTTCVSSFDCLEFVRRRNGDRLHSHC